MVSPEPPAGWLLGGLTNCTVNWNIASVKNFIKSWDFNIWMYVLSNTNNNKTHYLFMNQLSPGCWSQSRRRLAAARLRSKHPSWPGSGHLSTNIFRCLKNISLYSPPPTLLSGIQSLATVAGQSVVPELPAAIVLSVWKELVSVDAWRKLYSAVQYKIVQKSTWPGSRWCSTPPRAWCSSCSSLQRRFYLIKCSCWKQMSFQTLATTSDIVPREVDN